MKIQKEAAGTLGLDPNSMNKYQRISVKITDGSQTKQDEVTYDDGAKGKRTSIPILYEGEETTISFSKTNTNKLIDALGDDTNAWSGAEIDLIVVEYPSLKKQGFDIEEIRKATEKPAAAALPITPANAALKIIKAMDGGKGAPLKSVSVALQAEAGISADAVDAVILGLKNSGMILEGKNQLLKVI